MTDDPDDLKVRIVRVLPAPRPLVFAMCVEPDNLARWFGPRGFSAHDVEIDLRVGGAYRLMMQPPTGDRFGLTGEYRAVDAPERLVFTFLYEEPDPDDRETTVSMALHDRGDATEFMLEQGAFVTEARRALHEQGWTDSLDRLYELIATKR